jgi:polyisoprenoid-binding protein YceI
MARGGGLGLAGCAAALVVSCWLALPAAAQPVTYTLVPDLSQVTFEVLHFGTSTTRGRFVGLTGEVVLYRSKVAGKSTGEVGLRINTASVDTGISFFNARLRQDDLLASTAHPEAFFVARNFKFDGDRVLELRGEFTWRGVSQPLSLRAVRFACRQVEGAEQCGGDFEGELLRSAFGATFGLPLVGDRVRLLVQAEGRATAAR